MLELCVGPPLPLEAVNLMRRFLRGQTSAHGHRRERTGEFMCCVVDGDDVAADVPWR